MYYIYRLYQSDYDPISLLSDCILQSCIYGFGSTKVELGCQVVVAYHYT